MRFPKISGLVLLAIALATLILALGALQWRWVREASEAERGRMQSLLEARAAQFSHEFDRELTNIYGWFLAAPHGRGEPGRSQAERAAQWFADASRPQLVRELYVVRARPGEPLRLERFDTSSEQYVPKDWPAALEPLRERLTKTQPAPGATSQVWRAGPRIDASVPAVVVAHPVLRWQDGNRGREVFSNPRKTLPVPYFRGPDSREDADVVVTVAVLDLDVIATTVLPELAAKHFPEEPGFTFRLLVTDDKDRQVIFSVPGDLKPEAFTAPDAKTSLLRVRNEYLERVPGERMRIAEFTGTGEGHGPTPATGAGDSAGPPLRDVAVSVGILADARSGEGGSRGSQAVVSGPRDAGAHGEGARGPGSREPGPREGGGRDGGSRVSRMQIVLSPGFATGETVLVVPDMSPGAPRWTLSLVHAQGSLEIAVARTRRWNLGVSLGVLALLAASVSLALVASQRAQRLARERMEFVAGISHELRTPLSVIRSAAENLADGVVEARPQVQQYGSLIADEGRKLSDMVDQVLTFSTLESGHALRLQPAAIDRVVEDAVRGVAAMAEAAGMRVETRVEGPLPQVMADVPALGRVVTNLVTNAVKYAAGGGWVGITVDAPHGGSHVRVSVADRGPGISPQDQKRVFEPFFRGHDATAAQIHGNGLGLDLVRRIVEQHGGRVSLASEPGHGCRFTVELPGTAGASR
jgi:signal transduction histidine kinase